MNTDLRGAVCKFAMVAAILLLFAWPAAAQSVPPGTSPSVTQETGKTDSTQLAPDDAVLKKKSIFFPDLAASRVPLSADEKFRLAVKNSVSPAAFVGAAFGAGIAQATDSPSGYGQGGEGYGKRFGAIMANGASSNLFGGFILAAIAHQDPRYFVHGPGRFGARLGHAVTRVVVAPKDRGGYGFNWGGVFGPLGSQALANTYLPAPEQTGARTMARYGMQVATTAGVNVLKEFWPDIFKHLHPQK